VPLNESTFHLNITPFCLVCVFLPFNFTIIGSSGYVIMLHDFRTPSQWRGIPSQSHNLLYERFIKPSVSLLNSHLRVYLGAETGRERTCSACSCSVLHNFRLYSYVLQLHRNQNVGSCLKKYVGVPISLWLFLLPIVCADHGSRAVLGMNCLRSLGRRDRRFESY
jgi:hypothetical protein